VSATTTAGRPAPTPGYNSRLTIFFTTSARGRRLAWYWSPVQLRAFRLPLDAAEIMRATETADVVCCHPLRPHTCAKAGQR